MRTWCLSSSLSFWILQIAADLQQCLLRELCSQAAVKVGICDGSEACSETVCIIGFPGSWLKLCIVEAPRKYRSSKMHFPVVDLFWSLAVLCMLHHVALWLPKITTPRKSAKNVQNWKEMPWAHAGPGSQAQARAWPACPYNFYVYFLMIFRHVFQSAL